MSFFKKKKKNPDAVKSPKQKPLWVIAGWIALAAAFVGVLIPVIPQVPFAILAAFCFARGSPRLHHWLLNHNQFGPSLRDWEMDRVIRKRPKIASSLFMCGGAAMGYWKFHESNPEGAVGILVAFALAILFVLTRRSHSRPSDDSRDFARLPPSAVKGN